MGDIINSTFKQAEEWQSHLLWILTNLGFLRAEADLLDLPDEIRTRIRTVAEKIEMSCNKVLSHEVQLFYAAREAEIEGEQDSAGRLLPPLMLLRDAFKEALLFLNSEVEAFKDAEDYTIVSLLLSTCGTEILNSFNDFCDRIESFQKYIEV